MVLKLKMKDARITHNKLYNNNIKNNNKKHMIDDSTNVFLFKIEIQYLFLYVNFSV